MQDTLNWTENPSLYYLHSTNKCIVLERKFRHVSEKPYIKVATKQTASVYAFLNKSQFKDLNHEDKNGSLNIMYMSADRGHSFHRDVIVELLKNMIEFSPLNNTIE